MLLIAVLFVATALALPFNSGQAITHSQIIFPGYLMLVSFGYYGWFWTHGGQTPGLKTWKLKVLDFNAQPINWRLSLIRFSLGIIAFFLGLSGFIWIFFDKEKLALHDRLSKTRLFPS